MIEYRRATAADIPLIVETHIQCFQGYFLTSLGKKLLEGFYRSYFEECNLFIGAFDNGKMIGFRMGHLYPSEARRNFERKYAVRLFFRILFLCIKLDKPTIERVMARLFRKRAAHSQLSFSEQADANSLSLCVLEEYRRRHVAIGLHTEFESLLKQYNVKSYACSTQSGNSNERALLEKQGFSVIEEVGGKVRYIKKLEN